MVSVGEPKSPTPSAVGPLVTAYRSCELGGALTYVGSSVEVGGWDISGMPLGDAMQKAKVLDVDLQRQLYDDMQQIVPLPSVYFPSFIAANQRDRATHVLTGSKQQQMEQIRKDIREFKASRSCDKVIVLWTANTERFAEVLLSVHPHPCSSPSRPARTHPRSSVGQGSPTVASACVVRGSETDAAFTAWFSDPIGRQ